MRKRICVPGAVEFADLIAAVQACRRCASMDGRRRVLSQANGGPGARVMFVAEAPGRRGGEVTGVPLSRDASGQRFSRLLALAGLRREEVFITNTVLCNPRTAGGNNRAPSRIELANCAGWLQEQLRIVDPPVVVTLGAVALAATGRIQAHGLTLRTDVGRAVGWRERVLVPLYHPSPRAGLWRRYEEQDADFRRLGELVADLTPRPPSLAGKGVPGRLQGYQPEWSRLSDGSSFNHGLARHPLPCEGRGPGG